MGSGGNKKPSKRGKKIRVALRRNRSKRARDGDWTKRANEAEEHEVDADRGERLSAKGALSRRRTITLPDEDNSVAVNLRDGTVVAMRGLYADVDDGHCVWRCTIRRILRTRLIKERHPVTVGDRVRFRVETEVEGVVSEGVIEEVGPRSGVLRRLVGKRVHTIVANVDQAIIVTSAGSPPAKPHLIDRYLVAAHAGGIESIICLNKIDLPCDDETDKLLDRYIALGYKTVRTSAETSEGMEALCELLKGKASVVVGQSGVGKSSLLNRIEPGLKLRTRHVSEQLGKGRHTTTTARLLRLKFGAYVVDTPGIRTFDLSIIGKHELEVCFTEFVERVPDCKFPDCTHTHEIDCAVKLAVSNGEIHPQRYESYVRLFQEPVEPDWETRLQE